MAESIIEQIADAIKDVIDTVTTANGFHYTLTAVRPKRLHLEGDVNKDLNVIIEQDAEAEVVDLTLETITMRQTFLCQAIAYDSDDASTAIDTKLNRIAADIQKQMASGTNINLNDLAERVLPANPATVKFIASANASAISVNFDVIYHTDFGDPYNQNN